MRLISASMHVHLQPPPPLSLSLNVCKSGCNARAFRILNMQPLLVLLVSLLSLVFHTLMMPQFVPAVGSAPLSSLSSEKAPQWVLLTQVSMTLVMQCWLFVEAFPSGFLTVQYILQCSIIITMKGIILVLGREIKSEWDVISGSACKCGKLCAHAMWPMVSHANLEDKPSS